MANGDETLAFVIEQTTGTDPIKVSLENHDAPFGSARQSALFNLGGRNEATKVRLDGRQTPIIHTKYTVWAPNVVKGHLRDHFTGVDGHGQDIVKKLQDILDDQKQVKLTCGPWTWIAFPDEFTLPVEGENDFTYELKFEILSRPGYQQPERDEDGILPYPTDLTAEIRAELAAARAALLAQQIIVAIQFALSIALDSLDQALADAVSAATSFENANLPALAESVAMGSAAHTVKVACDDVTAELSSLTPSNALVPTDDASGASFQAAQLAMMDILDECRSRMYSVRLTANKRISAVSKVYTVAPGDTIDSIAQQQLGSAARASELNLRPQDLRPGRKIRIPKQ